MEYLGGDEYVVDCVSRDGVHKCVAIWKYIKQPLNGVPNVFYGQRLMQVDKDAPATDPLKRMVKYIFGVLDAIGIKHGAVHSEVKYDTSTPAGVARGPVLIETNCRLHGIEGSWKPIVDRCLGYSQVSVLLDAYSEDPASFKSIPLTPSNFLAHGAQVGVRSTVQGIITRIVEARLNAIRAVESYRGENLPLATSLSVGKPISKTVDILTLCGQINLAHASKEQLESDLARVQVLIDQGLFKTDDLISPMTSPMNSPAAYHRSPLLGKNGAPPPPPPPTDPLMCVKMILDGFCIQLCPPSSSKGELRGLFDPKGMPLTPPALRPRAIQTSH